MNNIHNQWCQSGLKSGVVQRDGGEISRLLVWIWALRTFFWRPILAQNFGADLILDSLLSKAHFGPHRGKLTPLP